MIYLYYSFANIRHLARIHILEMEQRRMLSSMLVTATHTKRMVQNRKTINMCSPIIYDNILEDGPIPIHLCNHKYVLEPCDQIILCFRHDVDPFIPILLLNIFGVGELGGCIFIKYFTMEMST